MAKAKSGGRPQEVESVIARVRELGMHLARLREAIDAYTVADRGGARRVDGVGAGPALLAHACSEVNRGGVLLLFAINGAYADEKGVVSFGFADHEGLRFQAVSERVLQLSCNAPDFALGDVVSPAFLASLEAAQRAQHLAVETKAFDIINTRTQAPAVGMPSASRIVDHPHSSPEEAHVPPARRQAYALYKLAKDQDPTIKTDKQAYQWLRAKPDYRAQLPKLDTFRRYVRDAKQVFVGRRTRPAGSASIAWKSEL